MLRMTKHRLAVGLLIVAPLIAGTTVGMNCLETFLLSVTPCGTVLTNCTPDDWVQMIWPILTVPDYERDPSCTVPYGCGTWTGTDGVFPVTLGGGTT